MKLEAEEEQRGSGNKMAGGKGKGKNRDANNGLPYVFKNYILSSEITIQN